MGGSQGIQKEACDNEICDNNSILSLDTYCCDTECCNIIQYIWVLLIKYENRNLN